MQHVSCSSPLRPKKQDKHKKIKKDNLYLEARRPDTQDRPLPLTQPSSAQATGSESRRSLSQALPVPRASPGSAPHLSFCKASTQTSLPSNYARSALTLLSLITLFPCKTLSNLLQECLGHGGRERMQREAKRQVLGTAHPMSQKAKRVAQ